MVQLYLFLEIKFAKNTIGDFPLWVAEICKLRKQPKVLIKLNTCNCVYLRNEIILRNKLY